MNLFDFQNDKYVKQDTQFRIIDRNIQVLLNHFEILKAVLYAFR